MSPKKSSRNSDSEKKFEEKFSSIFDADIDGVAYIDVSGKIVRTNKKLMEMMDYKPNETVGKNILKFGDIDPKDISKVAKAMKEVITTGKVVKNLDVTLIRKDGYKLSTKINAIAVKKDGKIIGIKTSIRNITEAKKIAEELKDSEEKFRKLFESSNDGIIYLDKWGKIIDVNKKALQIFGGLKKELLEKHFTKIGLFSPTYLPKLMSNFADIIKGKTVITTVNFKNKNGDIVFLECSSSFIKKDKKIVNIIVIARDITERKASEEKLKESEEKFRNLFEFAPDGIYLNDLKGTFIEGNKVAEELTGYKKKELIGKNFLKLRLLSSMQIPKAAELLSKNALGKSTGPDEFILNRNDGNKVVVEIRTIPIKVKDKTLVFGIVHDITHRKIAEEEVKSAQEKWDSLTRNTSDIIIIVDRKGVIQYISKTMPPYTPKGTVGKTIYKYIPKDQHDKIRESFRKVFKMGSQYNYEICSKIPNIGIIWFSTKLVPIKLDKDITGIIMISTDITERKKIEDALKKSHDEANKINQQLQSKIEEMERFNKFAIGRELKMVELKKRLNELKMR